MKTIGEFKARLEEIVDEELFRTPHSIRTRLKAQISAATDEYLPEVVRNMTEFRELIERLERGEFPNEPA